VVVAESNCSQPLSLIHGTPPKVIWLQVGNVSKAAVMKLLLDRREGIERLLADPDIACVEIG